MARKGESETVEIPRELFDDLRAGYVRATDNDHSWPCRDNRTTDLLKASLEIMKHVWRNGNDGRTPAAQRDESLRERAKAFCEYASGADEIQEDEVKCCGDPDPSALPEA